MPPLFAFNPSGLNAFAGPMLSNANGFWADTTSGPSFPQLQEIGYAPIATHLNYWTLLANSAPTPGRCVVVLKHPGSTLPGTLTITTSRGTFGTLGVIAAVIGVTSATVTSAAQWGARWTVTSLPADPLFARTMVRYTCDAPYPQAMILSNGQIIAAHSRVDGTRYEPPMATPWGVFSRSVEADAQVPCPATGLFHNMRVVAYSSAPGYPLTFTLRRNSTDTDLSITVTPTIVGVYSLGAIASYAVGDLMNWRATPSSWGTGTSFFGMVQVTFTPDLISAIAAGGGEAPAPFMGVAAPAGADLHYWHSMGSVSTLSGWLIAGYARGDLTNFLNLMRLSGPQQLYAMPLIAPRDHSLLSEVEVVVTAAGDATQLGRVGLWVARSINDLYPGSLVANVGTMALGTTGAKTILTSADLRTDTLYYLGLVTSAAAGQNCSVRGFSVSQLPFGIGISSGGDLVLGWSAPHSLTLDGVYPNSATFLEGASAPAIAYRFGS